MPSNLTLVPIGLSAAAQAVRIDHQRIDDQLESVVAARDLRSLAGVLERLSSSLDAHFLHEEAPGGLFELLADHVSGKAPRVQRLVEEHDRMLVMVRGLAARARALADRERDLYEEAIRFIERLHEHETVEDCLVGEEQRSGEEPS